MKYITNIFRPWSYLSISPYTIDKLLVDWIIPLLLSICCVLTIYNFDASVYKLFDADSFIMKAGGFIQALPGFYLAALAAIATFNKPDMDELLLGNPLSMVDSNGNEVQLTRRRFLTVMFAYLTAQCFVFILLILLLGSMKQFLVPHYDWTYEPFIAVFFTYLIFWQLITITLWGLFYLGEKIHIPNR